MTDEQTFTLPPTRGRVGAKVPTLTVLAHPDPARVASRAYLRGSVALSRSAPEFELVGARETKPLDDRYLSRTPVVLKIEDRAVWIIRGSSRTEVEIDGEIVTAPVRVVPPELERGVVLCLQGRVALLLHQTTIGPDTEDPAVGDKLGLEGCSQEIARVRRDIRTVAGLDVPVLIRGESGTGKELIARAIHRTGARAERHYEALNMATLSASLAASELFGHVRGAFTGANRSHEGCFVRADGGTLFLDEIGETPFDTQGQLLRVLETCDVRPVGGSASRSVDVRVIAATDVDLEGAVDAGGFREALLQRLGGFRLLVPPLRERRADIGVLIYFFVRHELEALGGLERLDAADSVQPWLSGRTVARLARYHWPGNVRELRNVIRQLVITGYDKEEISLGCELDALLRAARREVPTPDVDPIETLERPPPPTAKSYRSPAEVSEDELIAALRKHRYRLAPTAKALNLSRTSLYALVEQSSKVRKAADLGREEIATALERAEGKLSKAAELLEVSSHALKLRMRALGLER